ncbi:DUF418 domain-containing protein [Runella sp.]|uniref:DUF418 domain-containing protein n=1 Tax=Runella sp. TaxID=1960881 RepID=UPI003D097D6A
MKNDSLQQTVDPPLYPMLWGLAVLGALLLNIQTFGITQASINQLIVHPHGGNYWVLTIINTVFGNKFSALLSILFGAGIVLFFVKVKSTNGFSMVELFIRRQLWLMVFGLINAIILLWQNDLLFPFSIVGVLLFPLYRLSARALLIGAVIMALLFGGKSYWNFFETKQKYEKYQKVVAIEKKNKKLTKKKQVKLTDEQKADTTAWKGIVQRQKFDKKANEGEIKAMRSDYTKVWSHVLPNSQWKEAGWLYRIGLWEFASLMLLGMSLVKWGFFSNAFTTKQYGLFSIAGLVAGQALAWLSLGNFELRIVDITKYVTENYLPLYDVLLPFERALTAMGWASLAIVLYRSNIMTWLWRAFGAVGEMALTNYLLQTIACTLFFNGYGMSYFGELKFYQLYFIVAEIWLLQLILSVVWLRVFHFGPAEWLWYSLIQWKRQPMQKTESTTSVESSITA